MKAFAVWRWPAAVRVSARRRKCIAVKMFYRAYEGLENLLPAEIWVSPDLVRRDGPHVRPLERHEWENWPANWEVRHQHIRPF